MKLSVFGDTIVGKQRDHNEDSFVILNDVNNLWQEVNDRQITFSGSRGLIFAVADGMGGTNAGEVASAIALSTVRQEIVSIPQNIGSPDQVRKIFGSIIQTVNSSIIREAKKNTETQGMGTTIVLGWIFNNTLFVTWIGDSRCYHYNKNTYNELIPFSDDHSLVWSRVKSGEITPEEARLSSESNLLLQSLGDSFQEPRPDFKWINLSDKDRILLCSDGLNSMLSAIGIQQILDFSDSTKETCQSLINAANNAGGHDNITAILIDILETDKDTGPSVRKGFFKSKWFKGLITLLALALISSVVIITDRKLNYINKITGTILSVFRDDSNEPAGNITPPPTTHQTDTITSQKQDFTDNDAEQEPEEAAAGKVITKDKMVPRLKPEQAKRELQTVLDRIKTIRLKIEPVRPGKSEYQPEFYTVHSKDLESILYSLDSLENQIRTYAEIKEHEIISIKVTDIEENKIVSLINTIDKLNLFTENILSSQQ